MRNIAILGSTGSIGEQTLQIAAEFPDDIRVVGLAANSNGRRLAEQVERFHPQHAVLSDASVTAIAPIRTGSDALMEMVMAPNVDLVVVATAGAAGLLPTLAALGAGKLVALANKEALVMAGPLIKEQLGRSGSLVPIDSEHSAIWQCMQGEPGLTIERIVLTASGGAFRDYPPEQLRQVTPEQALRHPNWKMGPKVTIDTATLMNKGLEVIEATLLFNIEIDRVEVIMHRESIVHSLVYFVDSSVKAQLGLPDMRLPIQYALSHPHRWQNSLDRLELSKLGTLCFEEPDWNRYPCLRLAIEAGRRGGTYPAVLCAADEVAVDSYLQGTIPFTAISNVIEATLENHVPCMNPLLEDILQADDIARRECRSRVLTTQMAS